MSLGENTEKIERLVRPILVVTSSDELVREIQDLISPAPSGRFQCVHAPSLEDAISKVGDSSFDAILVDLLIGDQDGLDSTKALLAATKTPLIILTTEGHEAMSLSCLEAGAEEYLPKESLDTSTLRRALGYAISRHRADDLRLRLEHSDRLAALGQLTAGIAHEINNPSTYVVSNLAQIAELIARRTRGNPVDGDLALMAEMVADCRNGIELIASISRELTIFARTDDNSVDVIDVRELITNSSTMTLNEIRYRAKFEQHISDVPNILGSRSKLSQVLVNLLINAAHSIEGGTMNQNKITITADNEDGRAVIRVIDTGIGISENALGKIFENYYTTKPQGQGTGLGLPICKEIILQHNGTIEVTSQEGVGTTFTLSLPLAPAETPLPPPSVSQIIRAAPRLRVLLVDDEPLLLKSLARMLQAHHDVTSAIGGGKALEILAKDSNFDTIVCDLMMPEVDGLHVHEALKADYPHLVDKLLYLSGGVFTERMSAFLENQEPKLLDKPVSRDALLEAIADSS